VAERVDVCIVGSGFGGSIAAWRLAELYRAAGVDPRGILVLERGRRYKHTEFRQSMDVEHLSSVYTLFQSIGGSGAQMIVGNGVGGGSNLYLAASLRSPSETFERRDHHPDDGPDRRMWPAALSRRTLDGWYLRAERGLRVRQPPWNEVSKSGGLWAATLDAAGHSCDRVPLAIDFGRCVDAKWCHTGCIFGAKNTVTTNYLASAQRLGVRVRPNRRVEQVRRSRPNADGYRYVVSASKMEDAASNPSRQPSGSEEIECKVLIMAAGAMGTPPILMRSRGALPSLSGHVGSHLGVNGDHVGALEYDPRKIRSLLGLPRYGQFYKGKPITTMTYDFWVGRRDHRFDGTRFTLQEIFLSALTNFLYDDGRAPSGEPSFFGLQKKGSLSSWSDRIELLAMVEDTMDGRFVLPPPPGGGLSSSNGGPIVVGTYDYQFSEQSIRVRELADRAMKQVGERNGLARFLKLTESRGAYVAHPLGGCRMADSKEVGVVNDRCEAFDNEGLFCMDSSAIPTSLGVNPSLTIAAVCERAAAHLTGDGQRLGLPARPAGFRHRPPSVIVGERVVPRTGRRRRRRARR
jgi:enediyne biosynthesis protein E9